MPNGKPYSPLGEVMDELARRRNVRGPYLVAKYVRERTGRGPSGSSFSDYFYGNITPKREVIGLFTEAFELTEEEQRELAWAYTYRYSPAA